MYNYIWGNIFIYCQQHNIDFIEVYYKIAQHINENCVSQNGLMYSTMEAEINILSNDFGIPIAEIFNPVQQVDKIINFCKNILSIDCNVEFDKEKLRWDIQSIRLVDLCRSLSIHINKTFNYSHLRFDYFITIELPWQSIDTSVPYILLSTYYFNGRFFDLYDSSIQTIKKLNDFIDQMINSKNVHDLEDNTIKSERYNIIDFKDIIIKSSLRKCVKNNHHTYIINGIFFIIDPHYNIAYKILPLLYCSDCNVYYIYEDDYLNLCKYGKVLCRTYNNINNVVQFNYLNTESVFKICGYTVNANSNIPDKERQQLLHFLIERNIVSIPQTLDFFHWLIKTRKNIPSMQNAVSCWKDDLSYIIKCYKDNTINALVIGDTYEK